MTTETFFDGALRLRNQFLNDEITGAQLVVKLEELHKSLAPAPEALTRVPLQFLPEQFIKDAVRYRTLIEHAIAGDWGHHSGWRLNIDIKGAPSIDNIDDAIDAQFSLPTMNYGPDKP